VAHRTARRAALTIAAAVLALQVPYLLHRLFVQSSGPAMGAVTGGVWRILSGDATPEVAKSLVGYAGAFNYIDLEPWHTPLPLLGLVLCGLIVAVRNRGEPEIASLVLLPQVLAIAGYALFLDTLDHYYYIPVMPVAVLTMCLAVSVPSRTRAGTVLGIALCVAAVAIVPARLTFAATMHRLPEYRVLIKGSRTIRRAYPSVRAVQADFPLPPTTDAGFIYTILGGRLDPSAPWSAVIRADGGVTYRRPTD